MVSLLLGGLGLLSIGVWSNPWLLTWVSFTGVGIAWASILSMPYAMLSSALPSERMGVYMGIFNFFIVIPQILVAIVLSGVLARFEDVSRLQVVMFGGTALVIASLMTLAVDYQPGENAVDAADAPTELKP